MLDLSCFSLFVRPLRPYVWSRFGVDERRIRFVAVFWFLEGCYCSFAGEFLRHVMTSTRKCYLSCLLHSLLRYRCLKRVWGGQQSSSTVPVRPLPLPPMFGFETSFNNKFSCFFVALDILFLVVCGGCRVFSVSSNWLRQQSGEWLR